MRLETPLASEVQGILSGAVDLHAHPGPSVFSCRLTLLDAARQAAAAGFAAIVATSHHHSMVSDVIAVEHAVGELPIAVYSGIHLNNVVGGLNLAAVDLTLALGGRAVWFPTVSAHKHISLREKLIFPDPAIAIRTPTEVPVLDSDGKVLPEAVEILELIRDRGAILMGGHSDARVINELIATALSLGLERIVVNHPNFVVGADPDLCRSWARQGVYIEHSLAMYAQRAHPHQATFDDLLAYLAACGPSETIFGSDLGENGNPYPVESYHFVVGELLKRGVAADDLHTIVATNGRWLLDP
jgi:hypothetical protein